ncbi:Son of sevenless 2 [Geranomyces variabilis]|uniref:Son of sevenless 2 n=1 Tax=Geranomyces variabilis TaxID=109894 RepID=A0AAD5XSD7_9FUNG|nr:Son of sevenless 2 [Geranomyces variabilis]
MNLPQYNGPISESIGPESILESLAGRDETNHQGLFELSPPQPGSALRREYRAVVPQRKAGIISSPSFVADRIAMKRGESDGNLVGGPGQLHHHEMRKDSSSSGIEYARSNSAELLTQSKAASGSRRGTVRIREALHKRGDSLASLFRSKATQEEQRQGSASADSLNLGQTPNQNANLQHDDRKMSVDSATFAAQSGGRMQGWGSTLMRKARGAVTPEPAPTLKKKTSPSPVKDTMGRSTANRGVLSELASQSSDSSMKRYSSETGDDEDGDFDSTVGSMDDLQTWISSSSFGSLYVPKTVQLFVEHRGKSIHVKVMSHGTVADAIQSTLADLVVATQGDFHVENDRVGYRLCKLDSKTPGVRIWMEPGAILGSYDLRGGDEVRLKHINDIEKTTVIVPPSTTPLPFDYGFNVLVKDAVASLKAAHHSATAMDGRFGLYYPRLGIWLDDNRTVFSYELSSERSLELRALADQFLLRIHIAEFDQKIALKVLPGLHASDVIAMIHYQLRNRQLVLAHQDGRYGLFIPSRNKWMKESSTLDEYDTIATEDVHYKLQYESILVRMEVGQPSDPRQSDPPLSETSQPPAPLALFVDSTTTVETLLQTIALSDVAALQQPHCLFSPAGDRLNEKDLVWTATKDMTAGDMLRYRVTPKKVILTNTLDKDVKLDLDIDFGRPLAISLPFMCRRFGVKFEDIDGVRTVDGVALNVNRSLDEQRVQPGSKLVVQISQAAALLAQCISPTPPDPSVEQLGPLPPLSPEEIKQQQLAALEANIWEEDGNHNIQMTKDAAGVFVIGSGTLNKLIERLTDEKGEGTSQYLEYVRTFLLTYQSFATGAIVLRKLTERYHAPRNRKATFASYDHFRLTIQLRVCNVLLQWVKRHPMDFIKPKDGKEFWTETMRFTEDVLAWDQSSLARQIRRNLVKMKDNTHPALAKHLIIKSSGRPGELDPRKLSVFRYPVEDIAQQLTIIEHAFLADILPAELLNQAWSKPDADVKAANVNALTRRFNAVACWVAKSVLEMKTPRARAKRVSLLIDIAAQLLALNNFSTLMAIIAGLNKAAISRLKQTFKEVGSRHLKKLNEMERLMTAEGSYRNYRAHIRTVERPCVYLIDLTYMEDGNPDFIAHRINFTKRQMISGVINEIVSYQQVGYKDIKPLDELYHIIARLPAATDEYEKLLWNESKKRE